jgi:hypothetical protein
MAFAIYVGPPRGTVDRTCSAGDGDNEYYRRRGIRPDDVMVVAKSLGIWLEKTRALPPDERQRLQRAAYWMRHSEESYMVSACNT